VGRGPSSASGRSSEKKFPKLFYLVTPLLAILLIVGLAELSLIVFYPIPFFPEHNMYFDPDPHTGYRMRPKGFGHFGKVIGRSLVAQTNSHGHRDDETPLKKPEGMFRVLVLGDSMTFGTNVRQEQAYSQVLEVELRQAFGASIEVVSTGVGGWTPFQYAQYYIHYGHEFSPDLILVGFFVGNDTFNQQSRVDQLPTAILGRRVYEGGGFGLATRIQIPLAEYSHLARLLIFGNQFISVEEDLRPLQRAHRDTAELPDAYVALQDRKRKLVHLPASREQVAAARNGVEQIERIRAKAGSSAPVIVVVMPDENQVNASLKGRADLGRLDLSMPQAMLKEMFKEKSLRTIDLLPAFLANERRLYMNDSHYNPEGHRLIAEKILEAIRPLVERLRTPAV